MEQYLNVGVITTVHGVHGEVKVFPTTDDPKRFGKLKKILVDFHGEKKELSIESVKYFKQFVILKFTEANRIEEIEKYKGCTLMVPRSDAVKLSKNEYFICDLIGMEVYTKDLGKIGVLKDVLQTGANDVYIVDTNLFGEIMLPAIKECILKIDMEAYKMDVFLMPGLIDN